ncbi:MAG: PD-(D/E)XK nuclease family protein [Deltaproteobacteria bacterium]|nr:PD-(D/E)XK nuclease family protein [Myxococcales bacterium]MDP3219698.1 PD-(D/E)XK nuclease family protein [Deltaproteobacteria bacterium]
MSNITASRLELVERCPAAPALPAVWTESTDDQVAGTERHRFLQRAGEVGREAAVAEVPADAPWRAQVLGIDTDEIPAGGRYEIAYAYDVAADTAREQGQWVERAYDAGATEVSGTLDLVLPPGEGRPRWTVIDFKGFDEVAPAVRNLQLGFGAVALARVYDLDEVDVAIGYIGHGGDIRWDRATLGAFAIEAHALRIRSLFAAVDRARATLAAGGLPDFSTGTHCRYCAALPFCPAQTAAVRAFLADPPTPDRLALLSDEDAGRVWPLLLAVEEMTKRAKASVRARAELSGLPLPGGERLVPVLVPRRKIIDLDGMLAILREQFGAQADAIVERSLSFESVGELVRQVAPGRGQKKVLDALTAKLLAAKVVQSTSFVQLKTRKAKGDAPAPASGEEAA